MECEGNYNENLYEKDKSSGSLSVNIPAAAAYEDSQFHVSIEAWGFGYENCRVDRRIPVISATSSELMLSADKIEALVNEEIELELDTGELNAINIEFYNSIEGPSSYESRDENKYYRSFRYGEPGTYTVYAKAEVDRDGYSEWLTSEPVTITVSSNGKTGSFHVTEVNGVEDPEELTVQKGVLVNVKYTESQNADHYWVDLDRNNGYDDWYWYGHYGDTDQTEINIGTANLEPGEYNLIVKSEAVGYETNEADNIIKLTVEESSQPEMILEVSKTELLTSEEFTYSAYYPGASEIRVYGDYDNNKGWCSYEWTDHMSYGSSGTYRLVAVAQVYDEESGETHEVMASKVITVSAPNGSLEIATPSELPENITAGTASVSFTAVKPDNASGMRIHAWSEGSVYSDLYGDETDENSLDVNIDTSYLDEGTTICLRIEAWGQGYEHTEKIIRIPVIGETSDAVSIEADKTEMFVNEMVGITIAPSNVDTHISSARIFDGFMLQDGEWMPDEDGTINTELWFSESGNYTVYAKVQLEGTDEWITTEPISIKVNSKGRLSLEAPGVPAEICVDNDCSVTVSRPENAVSYGLEAYYYDDSGERHLVFGDYEDGEPVSDVWTDEEDSLSLTIPASALEEGLRFYVKVKGWGIGYSYNEVSSAVEVCGHEWGSWRVTTPATEENDGEKIRECGRCGKEETEVIPAGTHNLVPVEGVEASCETPGYQAYWECTECGVKFSDENGENLIDEPEVIPALGHKFEEWTVVTEASCTEAGEEISVCERCENTTTRAIDALGHEPSAPVVRDAVAATCSEAGHHDMVVFCARCSEELSRETVEDPVDPDAHDWGAWTDAGDGVHHKRTCKNYSGHIETAEHGWNGGEMTKAATCKEAGVKTFTCSDCGATKTEAIPATGQHSYGEWTVTKAATCTEAGVRTRTCTVCGDAETEAIPATGQHSYGEWTVTKAATCTEAGSRVKECTVCHDKVTEAIPATGQHSYGEWTVTKAATCTEAGVRTRTCTVCGDAETEAIAMTDHSYGEWTVTKAASCTEAGSRVKECSVCHDKVTEAIPATGHNLAKVEGRAATTEAEGNIEYWTCSECSKIFSDADGKTEITKDKTVIPKKTEPADEEKPAEPTEEEKAAAAAKEILNKAVTEAKKLVKGNYTDDSYKALQDAIAEAEALVANNSATKAQLDAAASKIAATISALKEKPVEPTEEEKAAAAAKEILNKAVTEAKKLVKDNYTDDSYKALQDAIAEAEALVANNSATKAQLDAAASKIAATISALKEKEDPVKQMGADGTALGEGASVQAAEAAIAGMSSDNDLPGSVFNKLQLKSSKQTNTSITISWKKINGAASYVIYGNKCGKSSKMQRLTASTGKTKKFTSVLGKKLKKGTYYKFMIVALDKNNNVVSSSKIIHVATKGGKVGNVGKITTKAKKNKASVKKGKTFKLAAKQVAASKKLKVKKHRVLKYESTNPKIATVSSKGVIKGVKKGKCKVYVYAQNGVYSVISVTVK